MAWSYNTALIATTPLFQVRRLIGDVLVNDQQMLDEEISFLLTLRPSIYGAAAECARSLSAQYRRLADQTTAGAGGNLHLSYSQKARAYLVMAAQFEGRAAMVGGGLPYAGGISVTDKQLQEQNTDRVAPQYNIGMEDNYLPVGSVGNLTNSDQPSEEGD